MGILSRLLNPTPAVAPTRSVAPSVPAATPPRAPSPPVPARSAPPAAPEGPGLVQFFTEDHHACDALWGEVEGAPDLAGAVEAWRRFDTAMRRHLGWEESVLFPAFEDATGHHGFGPTYMMRGEHEQMRALLDEMDRCAVTGDYTGLTEQGDTLMMMIQQHNAKEEGMLYPMTEDAVGTQGWQKLRARLT